ncbi:UvrD-helicase domain-containing protein [Luteolibacter sp. Populi]|uniref:UvrD-helicase domain-containing protein n=1 Tax=Luteolibacter sp. Populi TaxID=3230487 RepID=UPI0034659975
MPSPPTDEQIAFARHPEGCFLAACPGSGKTRTILDRLARLSQELPPRRGVAALSFTNAAVEEFKHRCFSSDQLTLTRFPNFIGTLDSFVRHFIFLPGGDFPLKPVILDSWDSLGIEVRLRGQLAFRGSGVSLDLFDCSTNDIDPDSIGVQALRDHVAQHRARYVAAAGSHRMGLIRAGYFSAGDARTKALEFLADAAIGPALARALSARFAEIIVDEGQDCNPSDLTFLNWLRNAGISVTLVCDPNQAIYEFRDGNLENLNAFRDTYREESKLRLTGNFRSSQIICRLASSLRSNGVADEALGDHRDAGLPIHILSYRDDGFSSEIGVRFLSRATRAEISHSNCIVLAHATRWARQAVGTNGTARVEGSSRLAVLASIVSIFRSSSATPRQRETAIQKAEGLFLDLLGKRDEGEHILRAIERNSIDRRSLRRQILTFLSEIPWSCTTQAGDAGRWIEAVRRQGIALNLELPPRTTIQGFFRAPPNTRWAAILAPTTEILLASSSVHEVKGHEYDGVCLVIPPNRRPHNRTAQLVDAWENVTESEAKRVIYVAATRARKLKAIALPQTMTERCLRILERAEVEFERENF